MIKHTLIILALTLCFCTSRAQTDGTYEYEREFMWGLNKSTTSGLLGGLMFRFGTSTGERTMRTIGVDLINVRHPAEVSSEGSSFKEKKINYLYSIRGRYGKEFLLFQKSNQQGVQINAHIAGGPTIGLESPYYILDANNNYVKYDPRVYDIDQIAGVGLPFQGLFESKIIPGANFKGSLQFEFGTFKSNITGVEIGFNVEAFTRAPLLQFESDDPQGVSSVKNKPYFMAAFINIFYGNRR